MKWTLALLVTGLLVTGCKKKTPVENPMSDPMTTAPDPEPAGDGGEAGDGVASGDDPETPAPEPKPAPSSRSSSSKSLQKAVKGFVALLNSDDVAKHRQALDGLEALKRTNGNAAIVDLNIGVAQQKLGNMSAAKEAYRSAKAKDGSLGHAYLYLGMIEEGDGDQKAAENLYRQGISADYENVDVRVGLVSLLRKQGKLDEAISEAQKALKVNSHSTEIYNDVGLAYVERGDVLLAKFMFRKALGLPGGQEKAYLQANLGRTYYEEGKLPEATIRLKKAVELDPNYVPGLVYLSRVYMKDHNYADTVDLLERAARQAPDNHGVQMNLGVAYRGVERFEDAKKAYLRALDLEPGNADPHFNLGILYGDYLKDYEAATASFERYKSEGGANTALADQYIEDIAREKKSIERRAKQIEAAKKREAERLEQQKLADAETERLEQETKDEEERLKKEAEAAAAPAPAPTPDPAPAPEDGTPEEAAPEDGSPEEAAPEEAAPEEPAPEPAPEDGDPQ